MFEFPNGRFSSPLLSSPLLSSCHLSLLLLLEIMPDPTYHTTTVPNVVMHQAMQDLHHQ